jgi:putative DNA primase/helicase
MKSFPVLAGIEALTVLVDNDPQSKGRNGAPRFHDDGRPCLPGQDAAEQCARRWRDAGREVTRLTPGVLGVDFNDLVVLP